MLSDTDKFRTGIQNARLMIADQLHGPDSSDQVRGRVHQTTKRCRSQKLNWFRNGAHPHRYPMPVWRWALARNTPPSSGNESTRVAKGSDVSHHFLRRRDMSEGFTSRCAALKVGEAGRVGQKVHAVASGCVGRRRKLNTIVAPPYDR